MDGDEIPLISGKTAAFKGALNDEKKELSDGYKLLG